MEYLRRLTPRKRIASPSLAKLPEGRLGQWPWLTSDSVKRHYTNRCGKISEVFCFRKKNNLAIQVCMGSAKVSALRWASKDQHAMPELWCGHLLALICIHFSQQRQVKLLVRTFRTISLKIGQRMYLLLWRILVIWHVFCQELRKWCLMSYTKFQRDPPSRSSAIPEKKNLWGLHPLHGRMFTQTDISRRQ